jgi:hypothetical protein
MGLVEAEYSFNVLNNGNDSVSEVRIRMPSEFSSLKCAAAPQGWSLAYSDAVECNYKTVSSYIVAKESLSFAITAMTPSSSGNFTWEVRTRDVFDGFSLHNPLVWVDASAPLVKSSTIYAPNGAEKWEVGSQHDILWSSGDIEDDNLKDMPVTLEYTTDGKLWKKIAENIENNGSYSWIVPDVKADKARVRIAVVDMVGNRASDESDGVFSIIQAAPTLSINVDETKVLDVNKDGKNDTSITLRRSSAT